VSSEYIKDDTSKIPIKDSNNYTEQFLDPNLDSVCQKLKNWGYPQTLIEELTGSEELFLVFDSAQIIDKKELGRRSKQKAHADYAMELAVVYGL